MAETACDELTPTPIPRPPVLLGGRRERKYNERLLGRGKDRERSLTNYRHGQNRLDLGQINLIYYQCNWNMVMRNKAKS